MFGSNQHLSLIVRSSYESDAQMYSHLYMLSGGTIRTPSHFVSLADLSKKIKCHSGTKRKEFIQYYE